MLCPCQPERHCPARMQTGKHPLAQLVAENGADELELPILVAQTIAMSHVENLVRKFHRHGTVMYDNATFTFQIVCTPDVMVAHKEVYLYPIVGQFAHLAQKACISTGNHHAILKPEVKHVPQHIDSTRLVLDGIKKPNGMILTSGPTGSGKSTTLAALVNKINMEKSVHIVTIEDPIEFTHKSKRSVIVQREVHYDTFSFARALKSVLREDPDVVLIGEMRDLETISAAITIAETGHLVFATLHTNSASQSIDRMIDVFPPHQQPQVRSLVRELRSCTL